MKPDIQRQNFIQCLEALRQDRIIAYPTEAVFGLGCNPDSELAVITLLALKQRPIDKGLILIADSFEQLNPYVDAQGLSVSQKQRMFASWPGPSTWVLAAQPQTPRWLTGQFDSLAVRVTAHPLVKELCTVFGKPLVSTSANLSGQPPGRTVSEVRMQFGGDLPVLAGETGGRTRPSEIRDAVTGKQIR